MSENVIDHKAIVASLTDEERLRLTTRSDQTGLLNLAGHVAGLMFTGVWILSGFFGWQVAMLLHGIQIVFLFTLLHETVHDTPFKSIGLNRAVGWMCGLLVLLPPTFFRYFHLAHHRHTHDPEKDPELDGKTIDSRARYLWAITGIPVWLFHIQTILWNAAGKVDYDFLPDSAKDRTITEARIMLAVYAALVVGSVLTGSTVILIVWIVPALLGQPFLRLYLMAEHGRCPHVANMLQNTRTTFTNSIIRWLAWNMPYHAEHHAYPNVPFFRLPEFHRFTRDHLLVTANGYREFHDDFYSGLPTQKTKIRDVLKN